MGAARPMARAQALQGYARVFLLSLVLVVAFSEEVYRPALTIDVEREEGQARQSSGSMQGVEAEPLTGLHHLRRQTEFDKVTQITCGGCTFSTDAEGVLTVDGHQGCGAACASSKSPFAADLPDLSFFSMSVKSIAPGAFNRTGLSSVGKLNFRDNEVAKLGRGAFVGLVGVQIMDLFSNFLPTVAEGVFDGLVKLRIMHLEENMITSIQPGAFSELANLGTLNLDNNHIASLEAGSFNGLVNLETLNLKENMITSIQPGAFSELANLGTLNLDKNHIASLEAGSFNGLANLETLNLEDNNITSLEEGVFDPLINLKNLYLVGNPLVCQISLPPSILSSQTKLPANFYTLPRCSGEKYSPQQQNLSAVDASPSSSRLDLKYSVEIAVRIEGIAASFDEAKRQQFLAAMRRASPSALNVTITSVTETSLGRRRLLAPYLVIGLEFIYGDEASAKSAAESDLAESNLYGIIMDAGLGTLTVTTEPTARTVEQGDSASIISTVTDTSTPTWVIIVAILGPVVAIFVVLVWRVRVYAASNRRIEREKEKEKEKEEEEEEKIQMDTEESESVESQTHVLNDADLAKLRHAVLNRDPVVETKFTEEARDIIMGKAKAAAEGLETLLCIDSKETFYRRISLEVAGIEEEVKQFVQERTRKSMDDGDIQYVGEMNMNGVKEVWELFHYIVYEGSSEKKYPNGIRDLGRPPGTRLDYFVSHPKAVDAGLSAAHVVALRMYTSSIYKHLNAPLRDKARKDDRVACALPVTTWYAAEGIKKLRTLHAPLDEVGKTSQNPELSDFKKSAAVADVHVSITPQPAFVSSEGTDSVKSMSQSSTFKHQIGKYLSKFGSQLDSQKSLVQTENPDTHYGDTLHSSAVMTSGTGFGAPESPGVSSKPSLQPASTFVGIASVDEWLGAGGISGATSAWGVPDPESDFHLGEEGPEKSLGKKQKQQKASKDLLVLWRGLRNTNVTDTFTQVGGTELAFMSTTSDIRIAAQYSMSPNSLLFKIVNHSFMSIGADINWLSTFPGEGEFLYPPLTYLQPTGRSASGISIKKGREVLNFTVVEVQPYLG